MKRTVTNARVRSSALAAVAAAFLAVAGMAPRAASAEENNANNAPSSATAAPQATPPPNYPPPPPRWAPNAPPPQNAYAPQWGYAPPPPPMGVYRPISFTLGVGPGVLMGPKKPNGKYERDFALSYNLFRLGFGVANNLALYIGFEGAGATSVSPETNEDSWLKQQAWTFGLQAYVLPRLYLRGGVGVGYLNETTDSVDYSSTNGIAMSAAIGYEFLQSRHVALALDLSGNLTRYSREIWGMGGLELTLSFF